MRWQRGNDATTTPVRSNTVNQPIHINIDYIIVVISCAAMLANRINNSERIYIHTVLYGHAYAALLMPLLVNECEKPTHKNGLRARIYRRFYIIRLLLGASMLMPVAQMVRIVRM